MGSGGSTPEQNACASCTAANGCSKSAGFGNGVNESCYQDWDRANPEPVMEALEDLIPISVTISCVECNQKFTVGEINADEVDIGEINQQMECLANLETAAQNELDEAERLRLEEEERIRQEEEARRLAELEAAEMKKKITLIIIILVLVVSMITGVVLIVKSRAKKVNNPMPKTMV